MLKVNDTYFPTICIFGVWYYIIRKNGRIFTVKRQPKKGLRLDVAQDIENEYKHKIYKVLPQIIEFSDKLINENVEEKPSKLKNFLCKLKSTSQEG